MLRVMLPILIPVLVLFGTIVVVFREIVMSTVIDIDLVIPPTATPTTMTSPCRSDSHTDSKGE